MPTPNEATAATSAVTLSASSCCFGMNSITTTPTAGRNTARVSAQLSKCMLFRLLDDDHEGQRPDGGSAEQKRAVLLDLS